MLVRWRRHSAWCMHVRVYVCACVCMCVCMYADIFINSFMSKQTTFRYRPLSDMHVKDTSDMHVKNTWDMNVKNTWDMNVKDTWDMNVKNTDNAHLQRQLFGSSNNIQTAKVRQNTIRRRTRHRVPFALAFVRVLWVKDLRYTRSAATTWSDWRRAAVNATHDVAACMCVCMCVCMLVGTVCAGVSVRVCWALVCMCAFVCVYDCVRIVDVYVGLCMYIVSMCVLCMCLDIVYAHDLYVCGQWIASRKKNNVVLHAWPMP